MAEAAAELKLAGQTYRVVTSAAQDELSRLASRVEDVLATVTPPGRQPSPQALVLAAITLAHELEEEQKKRAALEERHRTLLTSLLERIDGVLEATPGPAHNDADAPTSEGAFDDEPVLVQVPARARTHHDSRSDVR